MFSFDEREDELNEWLEAMLVLQHGRATVYGKKPKPNFEIIWQVRRWLKLKIGYN